MSEDGSFQQPFPAYIRREHTIFQSVTYEPQHSLHESGKDTTAFLLRGDGLPPEPEDDLRVYQPLPEKQQLGTLSTACIIINSMVGTGIFSQPSVVLSGTGSKGGALVLWVVGSIAILCSLFVYVEFGALLPFNGAELVYLEESYPRPKYLMGCLFTARFLLLSNLAPNCLSFAQYLLEAITPGATHNAGLVKFVAIIILSIAVGFNFFSRRLGVVLQNVFAIYKISLLVVIVFAGFAALAGARSSDDFSPYGIGNLKSAFSGTGTSRSPYDWGNAMLGVIFTYDGWEDASAVLGDIKKHAGCVGRTYQRGLLISFTLVSILYILANVAYFAASTTDEILEDGTLVAAGFFIKVFGTSAFVEKGLKFMVGLSAFGHVFNNTFVNAHITEEIAKRQLLPYSDFWKSYSPYDTLQGSFMISWLINTLILACVPLSGQGEGYILMSTLYSLGRTWCWVGVAIGLFVLRLQPSFRGWRPKTMRWSFLLACIVLQLLLALFVIILNLWPRSSSTTGDIPWFVTPVVSICVLLFGCVYWVGLAKIAPLIGYRIVGEEITLIDGSNVVRYLRIREGRAKQLSDWLDKNVMPWLRRLR